MTLANRSYETLSWLENIVLISGTLQMGLGLKKSILRSGWCLVLKKIFKVESNKNKKNCNSKQPPLYCFFLLLLLFWLGENFWFLILISWWDFLRLSGRFLTLLQLIVLTWGVKYNPPQIKNTVTDKRDKGKQQQNKKDVVNPN